jgi:DNA adenine methylase
LLDKGAEVVAEGQDIEAERALESPSPPLRARPFLRWAGGKTRLLNKLLPHLPESISNYHEPFLGSGAVFFAVRERISGTAYLSDLNDELINIWTVVQNRPTDFLTAISRYHDRNGEEEYYKIRSEQPEDSLDRAARFFFLNQTAWNGLWRVNRWGVFNVPWGARSFRGIDREALLSVKRALKGVTLAKIDFRDAFNSVTAGDFVYLDPPYLPISDTSKFSGYTERRFRLADLGELAEATKKLSERGATWVMSNRDTEAVRDLFGHGEIVRFTTRRSVAAQNRRDIEPRHSPEVIVVGRP